MKRLAALMASGAMALTIGGISVAAADDGYHAGGNSCDAGHGAFGAFSHAPGTIRAYVVADKLEGTTLGAETGAANSQASAACRLAN